MPQIKSKKKLIAICMESASFRKWLKSRDKAMTQGVEAALLGDCLRFAALNNLRIHESLIAQGTKVDEKLRELMRKVANLAELVRL